MKAALQIITALLFNTILAALIAPAVDVSFIGMFTGLTSVSIATSFFPMPAGLMAVIPLTLFEAELIRKFRHEHSWLAEIPSKDRYVGNNTINLVELGDDPNVLIDNTTYPIPVNSIDDNTIVVSLKKFDTENTKVTDDELETLPYDKPGSLMERHRQAMEEKTGDYALFSMAPAADSADTPIVGTSGADRADGSSKKRLTPADIIKLKRKFDANKVPKEGRVLVMCSDHASDLLVEDLAFQQRFHNATEGAVAKNYYGFTVYVSVYNPTYNANAKKAFDAAASGGDQQSSIAFHVKRSWKASGTVKAYALKAEDNPTTRESVFGLRLYFGCGPTKSEAIGAITDTAV